MVDNATCVMVTLQLLHPRQDDCSKNDCTYTNDQKNADGVALEAVHTTPIDINLNSLTLHADCL